MENKTDRTISKSLEQLTRELEKANQVIADLNSTIGAIIEDIKKIDLRELFEKAEGFKKDNRNGDSFVEMEQSPKHQKQIQSLE